MPRPTALLFLAAALALAPARAADLPIGAIAAAYELALAPGCGGALYPPSAELETAATACWGAVDAAAADPPTACPSDECRAFAEGMGRYCWDDFHVATAALRVALATALEGGKALPAAEVAKMQNVSDFLTAKDPAANPRSDLAAELEAGDAAAAAAAAAALRREAAYGAALQAACRPGLAPAPPAAPAPAATLGAAGVPTYEEAVAAIFKGDLPSCKDVLFPASAAFKAAQGTCAGASWELPSACPDKGFVCRASAPLWGAACLAEFEGTTGGVLAAASAALAGGPALPAADAARLQAWRDLLTARVPSAFPPFDWGAALEGGDIAYAAITSVHAEMIKAAATVCAAAAAGAAAAGAPVPSAAAAAAAASCARAPAAAAAALLALLALAA
jgi:hypothetical protein